MITATNIINERMDIQGICGVVTTQCVFVTGHNDFEESSVSFFRVEVGRVTINMYVDRCQ